MSQRKLTPRGNPIVGYLGHEPTMVVKAPAISLEIIRNMITAMPTRFRRYSERLRLIMRPIAFYELKSKIVARASVLNEALGYEMSEVYGVSVKLDPALPCDAILIYRPDEFRPETTSEIALVIEEDPTNPY